MDGKVLLKSAYSEADPTTTLSAEDHAGRWSHGASLAVMLLLSFGLWAAIWGAVSSVSAAL